ncbi:unnamed protein product [Ambrosiozyma monospora]|uniref:Unnamed protein product n=1 Tax=Ambrosiozyma monospora TaxID=43982 RepID=A0ACB5TXM2_AMBMO|nr:unnamed protein product [Ambrosiozyma monospora]
MTNISTKIVLLIYLTKLTESIPVEQLKDQNEDITEIYPTPTITQNLKTVSLAARDFNWGNWNWGSWGNWGNYGSSSATASTYSTYAQSSTSQQNSAATSNSYSSNSGSNANSGSSSNSNSGSSSSSNSQSGSSSNSDSGSGSSSNSDSGSDSDAYEVTYSYTGSAVKSTSTVKVFRDDSANDPSGTFTGDITYYSPHQVDW